MRNLCPLRQARPVLFVICVAFVSIHLSSASDASNPTGIGWTLSTMCNGFVHDTCCSRVHQPLLCIRSPIAHCTLILLPCDTRTNYQHDIPACAMLILHALSAMTFMLCVTVHMASAHHVVVKRLPDYETAYCMG